MVRCRSILMLAVAWLVAWPTLASAQIYYPAYDYYPRQVYYPLGYQFYGWGGWGTRIQGAVARGMGVYASGINQVNMRANQQAQAQVRRAELLRRWNLQLWAAQQAVDEAAGRRRHPDEARDDRAAAERKERLRTRPTAADIQSGDALNALYDQMSNPRLPNLAANTPSAPLAPVIIKQVPFVYSTAAVAYLLKSALADENLPAALRAPTLAPQRRASQEAVNRLYEEALQGNPGEPALRSVFLANQAFGQAVLASVPRAGREFAAVESYFKVIAALTRMLRAPEYTDVLSAADRTPRTTLEDMLAFMQMFNLRFGPATSPVQKEIYQGLYPLLVQRRDTLARQLGGKLPSDDRSEQAEEIVPVSLFGAMSWEQIVGRPVPGATTLQPGRRR